MGKKQNKKVINLKENLPLHKMDDASRRSFLKNCGIFMAVFGVSSMVRLETLEKLSKKIFGSSLAFAQGTPELVARPCILISSRAGLNPLSIIGSQTADLAIDPNGAPGTGFFAMNQSYATTQTVRVPTPDGPDLVVPSYNSNLTDYAGSIMLNAMYSTTPGGHRSDAGPVHTAMRDNNILSMCAESSNLGTMLTTPLAFTNPNSINFLNNNPIYEVQHITNINSFASQFVQETITSPDGTDMDPDLQANFFQALANSYGDQIEAALGTSSAGGTLLQNNQAALTLLQTNYMEQLSPSSAYNTNLRNALSQGLPANQSGINMQVNAVDAAVTGLRAIQLGIVPPYFALQVSMQDAHQLQRTPQIAQANADGFGADGTSGQGYIMSRAGQYIGNLMYNLLNVLNGTTILDNPVENPYSPAGTWADDNAMVLNTSEFGRSQVIRLNSDNMTDDNPDGNNCYVVAACANATQTIFKTGSFGGVENNGPTQRRLLYWNPSNNAHEPGGSYHSGRSSFSDNAKLLNLTDPDGVSVNEQYFL